MESVYFWNFPTQSDEYSFDDVGWKGEMNENNEEVSQGVHGTPAHQGGHKLAMMQKHWSLTKMLQSKVFMEGWEEIMYETKTTAWVSVILMTSRSSYWYLELQICNQNTELLLKRKLI